MILFKKSLCFLLSSVRCFGQARFFEISDARQKSRRTQIGESFALQRRNSFLIFEKTKEIQKNRNKNLFLFLLVNSTLFFSQNQKSIFFLCSIDFPIAFWVSMLSNVVVALSTRKLCGCLGVRRRRACEFAARPENGRETHRQASTLRAAGGCGARRCEWHATRQQQQQQQRSWSTVWFRGHECKQT